MQPSEHAISYLHYNNKQQIPYQQVPGNNCRPGTAAPTVLPNRHGLPHTRIWCRPPRLILFKRIVGATISLFSGGKPRRSVAFDLRGLRTLRSNSLISCFPMNGPNLGGLLPMTFIVCRKNNGFSVYSMASTPSPTTPSGAQVPPKQHSALPDPAPRVPTRTRQAWLVPAGRPSIVPG
jgi:hypothetical protein